MSDEDESQDEIVDQWAAKRRQILEQGVGLAALDEYNVLTLQLAESVPRLRAEIRRLESELRVAEAGVALGKVAVQQRDGLSREVQRLNSPAGQELRVVVAHFDHGAVEVVGLIRESDDVVSFMNQWLGNHGPLRVPFLFKVYSVHEDSPHPRHFETVQYHVIWNPDAGPIVHLPS